MSKDNLYKGFEVELFTGTFNSHIGVSADIEKKLISINAPLCKAMINKPVNEIIEFSTPSGLKEYQIKSISFK